MSQLDLFNRADELNFERERRLAEQLPSWLRLGTSSWTFSGWAGLVYPSGTNDATLREKGLALYCEYPLFSTVGIDRSFYRPLEASQLRRYRAQLPDNFQCVSKVFSRLTTLADPRTQQPNSDFLNPAVFEEAVIRPIENTFVPHQGPLVLEFPPFRHPHWLEPREFALCLDRFFSSVTDQFQYAVELRNRELLTPRYLDVLARHRVSHVFNYWEQMPDLEEQWARVGVQEASSIVVRLLIPPGLQYAKRQRELAPFDRIVDERPKMRHDVVRIIREAAGLRRTVFVVVGNKAEGSSPLTVQGIANQLVKTRRRD